ncbi:lipopolysaccharide heptosyltransferase II [Hydrogenimonas sp.]
MKLLIELPTWLGDAVMATPSFESLLAVYPEAEVTLVGSFVATEALKAHPRVSRVVVDRTKQAPFRPLAIYRLAKTLGSHDLAVSFRSHLASKLLLSLTGSKKRFLFSKDKRQTTNDKRLHQVQKYQAFVNRVTGRDDTPGPLRLHHSPLGPTTNGRKRLGINPGATYGSAKRWYPDKFADVAVAFADSHDILIFGGPGEEAIARDIETALRQKGVTNLKNLAGQTTIPRLIGHIAALDLFITNDSGPMHVAAAYQIPTVAIFGPTDHTATSQWMNPQSAIVRHDLPCAPCMKRTCPLKHHACMKEIAPQEVIDAANAIIEAKKGV